MSECTHLAIVTWQADADVSALWACRDCRRRFYPACETCVSVGHRGECDRAELGLALEAEWYNGNLDEKAYRRLAKVAGAKAYPSAEPVP